MLASASSESSTTTNGVALAPAVTNLSSESSDSTAVDPSEVMRYITSLNGDTMRWMNKRRPKNCVSLPGHVMPSIALQLKQLFDNFDFDKSGEIDLSELKQAVKFVADSCPQLAGQSHTAQDAKAITNFFQSMDVNNNGVVDFVEFLAAVAINHNENDTEAVTRASRRLQTAFIEFATQLRRQRLAQNLHSDNSSSAEKVEALKQLYSINYFVDSGLDVEKDPAKYKKQLKELNGGALQTRKKKEVERAREAAALIKTKKVSTTQSTSALPPMPRAAVFPTRPAVHSEIVHVPLPKLRGHGAGSALQRGVKV